VGSEDTCFSRLSLLRYLAGKVRNKARGSVYVRECVGEERHRIANEMTFFCRKRIHPRRSPSRKVARKNKSSLVPTACGYIVTRAKFFFFLSPYVSHRRKYRRCGSYVCDLTSKARVGLCVMLYKYKTYTCKWLITSHGRVFGLVFLMISFLYEKYDGSRHETDDSSKIATRKLKTLAYFVTRVNAITFRFWNNM